MGDVCDASVPDQVSDHSCQPGRSPAATLLAPYFQVGPETGRTTVFSITNVTAESRLASVTLWTDWAVPTLTFNVYLTGFDVATYNLATLLQGQIAGTGPETSPHGGLSHAETEFPGCDRLDVTPPDIDGAFLHSAHSGEPVGGLCYASPRGDQTWTGYLTIDTVIRCSSSNPSDAGYFEGPDRIAAFDNSLVGDVFHIDTTENFAQGEPMVHLRADLDRDPGAPTFYSRYVGGSGADRRLPLGTSYGSRFVDGAGFDGATEFVAWRDTNSPVSDPVTCGELPAWAPLVSMPIVEFDEEENAVGLPQSHERMPWATQVVTTNSSDIPTSTEFGWLLVDFDHLSGTNPERRDPGHLSIRHRAMGRFSVGYSAFVLDSTCTP